MSTLCTFPGRYGDLIWALPTVRAIARRMGEAVDLAVAAPFARICPLLAPQPYIGHCTALPHWTVQDTAPISPRIPPHAEDGRIRRYNPAIPTEFVEVYDHVLHLGYRGWPLPNVVAHTLDTANLEGEGSPLRRFPFLAFPDLSLAEPWIHVPPTGQRCDLSIAFTDEHFELKFGLALLVLEQFSRRNPDMTYAVLCPAGSRWARETWAPTWRSLKVLDWMGYATVFADARVVLADCSGAHALAVAMGKPVILMEPNAHRHNAVFYPLGTSGPQVTLVTGTDGQPTFDARHVTDFLIACLERTSTCPPPVASAGSSPAS